MPSDRSPLAIYIHIPFCSRKCSYCDFNAYSGLAQSKQSYTDALAAEIRRSPERGRQATSVYFGGGTPTQLAGEQLASLLGVVRETFDLKSDAEVTAEANPTTADAVRFGAMRRAGFNRLSIGVQAFQDDLLRSLEREHTAEEAEAAVRHARKAGFANVSIDLMFRLPGQTLDMWGDSLERAILLAPEHVSLYSLTIEPGTRFERLYTGRKLRIPDEDQDAVMFEAAIECLTIAGFRHYEISNFARSGFESVHNQAYWRNRDYAGFGAGAVSYLDGRRSTNEKYPPRYICKVEKGADLVIEEERLAADESLAESVILGLRMIDGAPVDEITARYGVDPRMRFESELAELRRRGLIAADEGAIRLTRSGILLADEVALAFLP